jgi:hypothetical protein
MFCYVLLFHQASEPSMRGKRANAATALPRRSQCLQEPNLVPGQIDGHLVTRFVTVWLRFWYFPPPNLVFPPLNQAQQVPTGPAIGLIHFQRQHVIASFCLLV